MNTDLDSRPSTSQRVAWAAICLVVAVLGCWLAVVHIDQPLTGIDDANIFFSYADNLAAGEGFVYNAGGERVEGFTSLAWTLICALAFLVSGQPESLLLGLNTLLVALATYQAGVFLWQMTASSPGTLYNQWPRWLVLALLACWLLATPRFMVWTTVTLMDTGLWCAALTCGTIAFARATLRPAAGWRSDRCLVGWTIVMMLTRPESMLVVLAWISLLALLRYGESGQQERSWIGQCWSNVRCPLLTYGFVLAALTLLRVLYFGYPLPNTFYAKVSPDLFYNLKLGLMYFLTFVATQLLMIPALLVVTLVSFKSLVRVLRRDSPASPPVSLLAASVGCCLVIPVLTGGDHFNLFRFFQPVWVLLALPMLVAAGRGLARSPGLRSMPLAVVTAAAAIALLFYNIQFPRWNELADGDTGIRVEFRIAAKGRIRGALLNDLFPEQDVSIGVGTAGGVGLAYEGPVIDLLGLNNVAMGHSAGDRKGGKNHAAFSRQVFFEQLPDIVRPTLLEPQMTEPLTPDQFLPPVGEFWDTALDGLERSAEFQQLYQPVVIDLRDPADQAWRIRAWCRPAVVERLQAAGVRFQLLQL